jgi:ABC-2 type transport system ATP-binding protein
LDEPTASLDPEASKMVRDFILELKKEKRTIFLNTHLLDEAERICDRVGILKTKLIAVGTPDELRKSLYARSIVVRLDRVSDAIVAAVKKVEPGKIEVSGNQLTIEVNNPETENPDIIDAIRAAGGRIQFVNEVSPSLEDIYMKVIKG